MAKTELQPSRDAIREKLISLAPELAKIFAWVGQKETLALWAYLRGCKVKDLTPEKIAKDRKVAYEPTRPPGERWVIK